MEWLIINLVTDFMGWLTELDAGFIKDIYDRILEICMLILAMVQVLQGKAKL